MVLLSLFHIMQDPLDGEKCSYWFGEIFETLIQLNRHIFRRKVLKVSRQRKRRTRVSDWWIWIIVFSWPGCILLFEKSRDNLLTTTYHRIYRYNGPMVFKGKKSAREIKYLWKSFSKQWIRQRETNTYNSPRKYWRQKRTPQPLRRKKEFKLWQTANSHS